MGAGIAQADDAVRVVEHPADRVLVAVEELRREHRLQVVGEGDVEHRVERIAAVVGGDLRRCCAARGARRSGRAVSTTWTLSHSLLKRRNVVAVFSSARTPSRNARSASTASSSAPDRAERRLPARQPFDRIGRREREVHRQRAARDLAEQAMAARVGGGDRVEVVEHRARRDAVVKQRRDHHRPAGRGRERLEERDLGVRAFGQHVDAAAAFAHRADERRHLGVARQPRRHRQAAFAVVRRARAAGEADRAVRHRVADDRLHLRDLVGARLAPRRVVAHHVGAHRGVADVGGDVGDAAALAQLRHVLAEALEAPVDAGAQRVDRHALRPG